MASLIDHNSTPSTTSVLDLFSVPPTQVAIDHGYWHEAHLVNTCTSEGPWQFIVQSDPHYLHLNRNYLYMKVKITKGDDTALDANDTTGALSDVAPINILGKTLFQQVKVLLNGKLASDSGPMYAYRSYLETELNYGTDAKQTMLEAAHYQKDTPADSVQSTANTGWRKRGTPFKDSKVVELFAPVHCDLFMSDRVMISNAEIMLELHRSPDHFVLMCFRQGRAASDTVAAVPAPNYKLKVIDMKWYVRKLQLMSSVHLGIEAALAKTPAKYPMRRVQMAKLHISPGRQSVPTTAVFNGQVPRRMIVGFVGTENYFGTYKTSPFHFNNNKISEIAVHAAGHTYPREPLKMDFAQNHYMRAYMQLFEGIGIADDDKSNGITKDDFKHSTCLFVFDLTPEEMDVPHWQLLKEGTTTVHCQFIEAIKEPGLEMIVYAEFDNLALVDRTRTIYYDYSI